MAIPATARSTTPGLPQGALIGAAILIVTALLMVGAVRLSGTQPAQPDPSPMVAQVEVSFEDRADGAVLLFLKPQNKPMGQLAPGTNGFVRGVLRGLARERRAEKIGPQAPFRLTRWADGRLSLDDPATSRHVDLEVFGPTNAGAFATIFLQGLAARETP